MITRTLVFLTVLVFGLAAQEEPKSSPPPAQPIPYSHKTHLALGLKCQDCHPNPEPGNRMTFPATAKCMSCHVNVAKDRPAIQKLAEFAKSKQPVPWVRVYALPAEVFWSHRSHLDAGMKCDICHGDVTKMDTMARVTNVATMDGCVQCHTERGANTGCDFCHEGK